VSLYISDSDSNGAISLQLLPKDLAGPVEIKIEQDAKGALSSGAGPQLNSGGLMNHGILYVNEIKRIMQAMAKRQIPQGFAMEENSPANLTTNICHDSGFAFMPGQVLTGQDSRIIVLVAQNNGSGVRLLDEAFCANEGVIAVSAWPKVRLHPGGKTEVYVLMRTPEAAGGEQIRPALF
jgi:conjugal transfer pilus assembly protein TraK